MLRVRHEVDFTPQLEIGWVEGPKVTQVHPALPDKLTNRTGLTYNDFGHRPITPQDREFCMAKIFVRERNHISKGEGLPRFAVLGVEGSDLKFFQIHVRKSEIDAIAQAIGAEVVMLPRGTGEDVGEGSGGGKREKRSKERKKK
jgi:hypothetical protein